MINFVTSSEEKKREISAIIPNAEFINKEVLEIQPPELSIEGSYEVVKFKARFVTPYFVEDTSLFIKSLKGYPGSLVKYVTSAELCKMLPENTSRNALAVCLLAQSLDGKDVKIYEGHLNGTISLSPRGYGFGWDDIFIPEGEYRTLAELGEEIKINRYSMRSKALKQLIGQI